MKLRPITEREKNIVRSMGEDDWRIVEIRQSVPCLKGAAGALIEKNGHWRWVKKEQIST